MTTDPALAHPNLGRPAILLMALACGVIVANLYYAQTLIDVIGPEIGMSAAMAGLITTLTQLGYGLGLFLIVPVADLFENRRIVLGSIIVTVIACLAVAASQGPTSFLVASILTGVGATGAGSGPARLASGCARTAGPRRRHGDERPALWHHAGSPGSQFSRRIFWLAVDLHPVRDRNGFDRRRLVAPVPAKTPTGRYAL